MSLRFWEAAYVCVCSRWEYFQCFHASEIMSGFVLCSEQTSCVECFTPFVEFVKMNLVRATVYESSEGFITDSN